MHQNGTTNTMDNKLHPDIPLLLNNNKDLIAAFRHAATVNPYQSPYIPFGEQPAILQQIITQYQDYLLTPYEIYYHVQEYVINKGHIPPYPHKLQYYPRPIKRQQNYLFSAIAELEDTATTS